MDIVIFCIGTDKATGDSFAPLVGTMLQSLNINAYVYGTLRNPITAKNIHHWYSVVRAKHPNKKILAIDSCLGKAADIGKISIQSKGLTPGLAVGKNLGVFGDYSILGFVDELTTNQYAIFKTPLGVVYEMAVKVSNMLKTVLQTRTS
ncbi:MAG: spore protease YyaC [Firmicutes bacterium]|nr:spore protease YyaC [Bacillota bacterium]